MCNHSRPRRSDMMGRTYTGHELSREMGRLLVRDLTPVDSLAESMLSVCQVSSQLILEWLRTNKREA